MAGYYEELYGSLIPQALPIVSGMLSGFDRRTVEEVIHDVTVDFLFHSNSFRNVFDHNKDVGPFFRAYVRLRARRYRDRLQKGFANREVKENSAVCEDFNTLTFEVKNYAASLASHLSDKVYYSTQKSINMYDLFVLSIMSFEEYGKTNPSWIARHLGCKREVVRDALKRMRVLLREKMDNESLYSSLVHEG